MQMASKKSNDTPGATTRQARSGLESHLVRLALLNSASPLGDGYVSIPARAVE